MYLYTLIKYLSEIVIYYAVMNCSFSQNAFLLPLPTSLFNAMSKWRFQILKLFLYFLTLPFCGRLPRSYWVWGAQVEGTCPDSSLADHQSPLIQSLGTLSPQDLLLIWWRNFTALDITIFFYQSVILIISNSRTTFSVKHTCSKMQGRNSFHSL